MISDVLSDNGYDVYSTDLKFNPLIHYARMNFLTEELYENYDAIITNPPFSLKEQFYKRCIELGKPFALLIPADYSGWLLKAIKDGAQRITPTRRIDYLAPYTLERANEHNKSKGIDEQYSDLEQIPNGVLRKISSSDFHSFWLTKGFNLDKMEEIVELSNEDKFNIW